MTLVPGSVILFRQFLSERICYWCVGYYTVIYTGVQDNRCEELTQENIRLLEERDTLQLKLSSVMRQVP